MRYVIGVCILTGLIVWDAVYYDGRYLGYLVSGLNHLFRSFGIN